MRLIGERKITVHEVEKSQKHWGYVITGSEGQGSSEIDDCMGCEVRGSMWSWLFPYGHPMSVPTRLWAPPSSP